MKTAYALNGHTELASVNVGKEYGHVPGHQYHDVDVVVSVKSGRFRCHVVESWGSCQGYNEEHGRREAVARGGSISEACQEALRRAMSAGITCDYLASAVSLAEDEAEEFHDAD